MAPASTARFTAFWTTMSLIIFSALVCLSAQTETSSVGAAEPPFSGEVIVVTAARTRERARFVPYATTSLDEAEIGRGRPTISLGESLSQVPGVFAAARGNFAQDTRIAVRGFGARAPFGVRGLRIFLDGIPLTLPDGQSQTDSLDLANVARLEVLRGPAASLYGNSAGGVLLLESKTADEGFEAEVFNLIGGFETWKLAGTARGRVGQTAVSVFFSRTSVGGFRDRSEAEQFVVQARTETRLSLDVDWSNAIHYVNAPIAQDPGGLTPEQFRSAPEAAAEVNERFGTGEALAQLQAGSRLVARFGSHHRMEVSAHAGLRDFENAIPFRTVAFSRTFFGGLLVHRWEEPDWLSGHRLAFGLEAQGQQERRDNQGNDGGRPNGEVELLQQERAYSVGLFLQERLDVSPSVAALASVRFDRVSFELFDDRISDGDATGSRAFDRATGQGGLVLRPLVSGQRPFALFANVAQSFETPTLSELVNADGAGLSPTLEPQRALSMELGMRGGASFGSFEVSGFYIRLRDELIADEDMENRVFFTNAGRSRRVGVEASATVEPVEHVELMAAYSFLRSTFREDGEARFGKSIPGLPEHRLFSRLAVDTGRLFGAFELEWVDGRYADDENTVRAPPHTLGAIRLGARFRVGSAVRGELVAGIQNLFDVPYVDNVRINAFGRRYFEPGAPLSVYGLLRLALFP